MPKRDKPNYTELTHQVVRESNQPLPFDDIMRRVHALAPITTRNPQGTIRNTVSQSRLIVNTGDGRYGWMPRVINGSAVRLTLLESDLVGRAIEIGDEARELLWPTFFEIQKRSDRSPISLQLPDRTLAPTTLEFLGAARWGIGSSPEFWAWFAALSAAAGDHLILRAIDGEPKLYAVEYQSRAARDEAAIAARNQAVVQAAVQHYRQSYGGAAIWDTAAHLLATGQYRHPIPPDPLSEIWTEDIWKPLLAEKGIPTRGWYLASPSSDDLARELFQNVPNLYDYDHPQDLPREYQSEYGRRTRPSAKGQKGPVKTFVLRVNHRALPGVWRDIEIAEDQTLEDLHLIIQAALEWNDDHLYAFFLSGRAYDEATEIGSPWSETRRHTHQVRLADLDLKLDQRFLYFFDYGDSHEFDVRVRQIKPAAPKGKYPRIVERHGTAPPQYPDFDEETGEPEWDPYARPENDPLAEIKELNRRRLHRIWRDAHTSKKLAGEEAQLAQMMREHPEWRRIWNRLDRISDEELTQGDVNPVMHLVVHSTVVSQIEGALPEVGDIYQKLIDAGVDRHEAIHRIGAVFMTEFYHMLKAGQPFDQARYLRQLKHLIGGTPRSLHSEPRPRRR